MVRGKAGAAAGGAGGRRHRHPRGAHAELRARASAAQRVMPDACGPAPGPMAAHSRPPRYANEPGLRAALAMTQQTATWQGLGRG